MDRDLIQTSPVAGRLRRLGRLARRRMRIDGDDVNFLAGPAIAGQGRSAGAGDGSGIRYVAFCYDAEIERASAPDRSALRTAVRVRPVLRSGALNRGGSIA